MRLTRALPDLLYPPKCPFCGRILERGEDGMCALCQRGLPWTDGPGPAPEGCDLCLSPLHYRDGVRRAVHRYKFEGGAARAALFGKLMARCLSGHRDGADLVTWAPLHPKRKKRRGYDQAELLALRVAELCGIPAAPTLEKIRLTGVQSQQRTEEDRRDNVEGAYRALPGLDLTGKRVVLVDDVVTTGSTLAQCAACLRGSGAAEVIALTFARAGEKRGETGCEGAWSGARASAGPHSGPQTSPSRSESDRASSPLRSVTTSKRGETGCKRAKTGAERNAQRGQRPRRAFCGVVWLRTFASSPLRSVTTMINGGNRHERNYPAQAGRNGIKGPEPPGL